MSKANRDNRLTSEELTGLIVDALFVAKIVSDADFERASKIVLEEIEVRKAVGDY